VFLATEVTILQEADLVVVVKEVIRQEEEEEAIR